MGNFTVEKFTVETFQCIYTPQHHVHPSLHTLLPIIGATATAIGRQLNKCTNVLENFAKPYGPLLFLDATQWQLFSANVKDT